MSESCGGFFDLQVVSGEDFAALGGHAGLAELQLR